jgi:7,8-dihydropterin-6-yl-methyl-4-(beta-D-ribofuranosyl)aminobenzene 5'-phosphate synthase
LIAHVSVSIHESTVHSCIRAVGLAVASLLLLIPQAVLAASGNRITILYDAFGDRPGFVRDWGFAALVEYDGKRILFDTGNSAKAFAANVEAANADLQRLDFAVISHRHLDHAAGLSHLFAVNPEVKVYVPKEAFGMFGSKVPGSFLRRDDSLAARERYFNGELIDAIVGGSVWPRANLVSIEQTTEVAPGIYLIALVSDTSGTRELRELSLAIRTPQGIVLVVGCSHPGIERIVEAASAIDPHLRIVFGGFHMPAAPDTDVARVATALHEHWKVDELAPGHCTGEPAFAHFKRVWGRQYRYAGVGTVLELP